MERENVVIIGAGQAGLSVSYELSRRGVEHVVLERGRVGQTWRGRWASFCLVTPNWSLQLPGHHYAGDAPDGFMARDEVVAYLEAYAGKSSGQVREGVTVTTLEAVEGGFTLGIDGAPAITAKAVVVTTGAYQRPHRPAVGGTLPQGLNVIDAEAYTSPADLPDGGVLVVGSGQTGCQLAEELRESGREVHLACGRAPWNPRRIGGRDFVAWFKDSGFMEQPPSVLASPAARLNSNPQASGRDGGHDLNYRTLRAMGVTLVGRLTGADDRRLFFADDLGESVAFGDARWAEFRRDIEEVCTRTGVAIPEMGEPPPFDPTAPSSLDAERISTVVFTSGFRPDYASWVRIPAFDELGFPQHHEGQSIAAPGLYFVGVHFLRKRKSSIFLGVGEDAEIVARQIAG